MSSEELEHIMNDIRAADYNTGLIMMELTLIKFNDAINHLIAKVNLLEEAQNKSYDV